MAAVVWNVALLLLLVLVRGGLAVREGVRSISIVGHPSAQSSTVNSMGRASHGNDGNEAGQYWRSSCTHTNPTVSADRPLWWMVDLLAEYDIYEIRIVNRVDCCEDRLKNLTVIVSQQPVSKTFSLTDVDASEICATRESSLPRGKTRIQCKPTITGRYVILTKPANGEALTICEVQIRGQHPFNTTYHELSLVGKPSSQSSLYKQSGIAIHGNDGNPDSNYRADSCTHTADQQPGGLDNVQWWMVDLEDLYEVSSVTLVNRGDCCDYRLRKFTIRIMNETADSLSSADDNATVCASQRSQMGRGEMKLFSCSPAPITGRYIIVSKPNNGDALTMCEVYATGIFKDTFKPKNPENFNVSDISDKWVKLSWNAPSGIDPFEITMYRLECDRGRERGAIRRYSIYPGHSHHFIWIYHLTPSSWYNCSLFAATLKGLSPPAYLRFQTAGNDTSEPTASPLPEIKSQATDDSKIEIFLKQMKLSKKYNLCQIVVRKDEQLGRRRRQRPPSVDRVIWPYEEAKKRGLSEYVAGQLSPPLPDVFVVGDGKNYGGFWNSPLEKGEVYVAWVRVYEERGGVGRWVYQTATAPIMAKQTKPITSPLGAAGGSKVNSMALVFGLLLGVVVLAFIISVIYSKTTGKSLFNWTRFVNPTIENSNTIAFQH
ncbi:uncharacterized protein LOC141912324 [Tubulanus polymorphus]|uniref:uncharacterized protein LOC141912324 n=1 Tax=Tubulanus polymorphus TaxID=672921 RepID=UPI003DA2A16A